MLPGPWGHGNRFEGLGSEVRHARRFCLAGRMGRADHHGVGNISSFAAMHETTELKTALQFVIRRIDEEAMRSGGPLTEEQRFLLEHLPTEPVLPEGCPGDPEYPPVIAPRDLDYEKLCALAKGAHRQDLQLNPGDRNWLFAKAVTELHKHPMSWLLGWARVKLRRPWWDGCLLVIAGLIATILGMLLMFIGIGTHLWSRWPIVAAGWAALIAVMRIGTRRLEQSQLRRAIEMNRPLG
jgi:hypothetical protein